MDWYDVKRLLESLLLPPGGALLLALIGLATSWRSRRHRRAAMVLTGAGIFAAWALSTGFVAGALMGWVEGANPIPLTADRLRQELRGSNPPGAIVVLGGGVVVDDDEERSQTQLPNGLTFDRLAYGAMLARHTGLPVLVSGGRPPRREESEARTMARTLETNFGVHARWLEEQSRDTAGNARESARILREAGIGRIILVTQAYHMRRARPTFEAAGLEVLAAPHSYAGGLEIEGWDSFVPNAGAMAQTWLATHETLGWLWYRVRHHL